MILSDEQLAEAEQLARRFQGAWTGTSGSLASWLFHAIHTIRQERDMNRAEQLLHTATETVRDRRATYGPPADHFAKTVAAINAIFAHKLRAPLTVADWAQIMILDKLARHQGAAKSADTPVDLAGYAACLAEVEGCETST